MNRLNPLNLIILLATLLTPLTAQAQQKAADAFAAVMQNAGHKAAVMDSAKQSPAWSHMACPTASFAQQPEIGVYLPIQFNPAGQPVAGVWREGVIATGCGTSVTLNVLTKVTAPATLASGPLLPGGTIADPVLQNDAQANAVARRRRYPARLQRCLYRQYKFRRLRRPHQHQPPQRRTSRPLARNLVPQPMRNHQKRRPALHPNRHRRHHPYQPGRNDHRLVREVRLGGSAP